MTGKSFKITIIVLLSILFTVLLSLVLFAAVNGYSARYMTSKMFPGTVENIYKPYKIVDMQNSPDAAVAGCDGHIYILNDKNLTIYDEDGIEQFSGIMNYEEAFLSSGTEHVLIYDKATGDYIIFEDGKELYSDTIGRTILGAMMQDNGYVVFILKGKDGFLGSASILNDSNKIIATCNYSDRFPVSGCTAGDVGKFVVNGIYANDTNKIGIDIYELYNEVPIAGVNKDLLLPLVMSMGKDSFVAAGNKNAVIYDENGSERGFHEFTEVIRMAAADGSCWIADRRTGADRIVCLDKSGKEKWAYATGLLTNGMVAGERHIFYWSGMNAECLDDKGRPVDIQSGFDLVLGIVDMGSGKVAVLTTGRLIFYEYH